MKNNCRKKRTRNIAVIVLPNNKEKLALVLTQKDQTPQSKRWRLWETFRFFQWFLHQCSNGRFLVNFVFGDQDGFALNGVVNNLNVRMYAPANQPPEFHYNVNNSSEKLSVWVRLRINRDILGLSSLTETLMDKVVQTF